MNIEPEKARLLALVDAAPKWPLTLESVRTTAGMCHKLGPIRWKDGKDNHVCIYDDYPGTRGGTPELVALAKLLSAVHDLAALVRAMEAEITRLSDRVVAVGSVAINSVHREEVEKLRAKIAELEKGK